MVSQYEPYLRHLAFKNCARSTLAGYRLTLDRFFREHHALTAQTAIAFLSGNHKPSTKATMRAHLKGFAKYARIEIDWDRDVPAPKVHLDAPVVYTKDEVNIVYNDIMGTQMRADLNRLYADVFLFICETGLRVSECAGIRMENVRLEPMPHLLINKDEVESHSKDGRVVPLSTEALAIIEHYGLPFRFRAKTLRDLIARAVQEHGLNPKLRVHSGRKHWATEALGRGVEIMAVTNAGGWSDPKTLKRYVSASASTICEAFA
jgi:integrase